MSMKLTSQFVRPVASTKMRRVAVALSLTAMFGVGAAAMSAQTIAAQADAANQPTAKLNFFSADPVAQTEASSSSSAGVSSSADTSLVALNTVPKLGLNAMQYGGGRRYGRPRYRGGNSNPDGSNKWMAYGGAGLVQPIGNTWHYFTPNYGIQVGFGRQYSYHFAMPIEFDYDTMGLTKQAISNQSCIYTYTAGTCDYNAGDNGIDATAHVWSFSIDPRWTLFDPTKDGLGAYVLADVGFYHKVTDFTAPQTAEYCDPYYGCQLVGVQSTFDHYTSNAPGFGGGIGFTYKFSHFSNERFYAEGRYVFMDNSQRYGYTVNNIATTSYNGFDAFPANSNRTTIIPIKFGISF
jgi:hypothetical protein